LFAWAVMSGGRRTAHGARTLGWPPGSNSRFRRRAARRFEPAAAGCGACALCFTIATFPGWTPAG